MSTKEQERRLRNWARANKECPRAKKGATLVFCESLRYYFDKELEEGEQLPVSQTRPAGHGIDIEDANLLDMAYRDERMTMVGRNILRQFYCSHTAPRIIEHKLCLGHKTFYLHKDRAIHQLFEIVELLEKK